jgi:hypothetical protein
VPHDGHAVCGSFCSRQFGQLTRVTALVFHCERLDRVLLRDIFRFGTATSALLSVMSVRHFFICQAPQRFPPRVRLVVAVGRAHVRQSRTALRT